MFQWVVRCLAVLGQVDRQWPLINSIINIINSCQPQTKAKGHGVTQKLESFVTSFFSLVWQLLPGGFELRSDILLRRDQGAMTSPYLSTSLRWFFLIMKSTWLHIQFPQHSICNKYITQVIMKLWHLIILSELGKSKKPIVDYQETEYSGPVRTVTEAGGWRVIPWTISVSVSFVAWVGFIISFLSSGASCCTQNSLGSQAPMSCLSSPPFIESVLISFGSRCANLPGLLTILPKSTLSLSRPLLLPFRSAGYKLIHSVVKSLQLPQARVHTLPLSYPR